MLELYKNIKKKRTEMGWSQTELALKVGYSDKSMIAKIEKGEIDLTQTKIVAFANAFKCSASDLMGWSDFEEDIPPVVPGTGELLDLYSRATPEQRQAVINLLRSFVS